MADYDLVVIGSGSVMNIVEVVLQGNPDARVAVIDKDEPGGICLTRGCIPSKILIYSAEVVRMVERAGEFGVEAELKGVAFERVMERMRALIGRDINAIRAGLTSSKNLDYFHAAAEFVAPYTLRVGDSVLKAKMIILCTGSRPEIPRIAGLEEVGYLTSDTLLGLRRLPKSLAVVGGGYIAAEYSHFFSAMGSEVTVIGRNPQFLPDEESEVSAVAKRELGRHLKILTNCEVREAAGVEGGGKRLVAVERGSNEKVEVVAEEVLVAAGRGPNTDVLHPERAGIKTDARGWIVVDEFLQTSQPNVWAMGDADGRYLFKHKANYESLIVYRNAVLGRREKVDYHAVPHAVFTDPEVASVGLKEREAIERYGEGKVLVGVRRYEDTAKGEAMNVRGCFAKVIVEAGSLRVLGAHIVGPYASTLIQEVVDLMYTSSQSAEPIVRGMHIHPALSEVVEGAFRSLTTPEQYHHLMEDHYGLSAKA